MSNSEELSKNVPVEIAPVEVPTQAAAEVPMQPPAEIHAQALVACDDSSTWTRTLGWVSFAAGMVTLGYFIGRQLRARYNFRRRTPYDFYSHAGDEQTNGNAEYGVGI
ncbi:MAG TPA: hypothetical protein VHX63_08205 [Acidobacteriaceae bacterium]|nr:hypothetical protein [Acidobacteriaceae bacterium]